MERLLRHISSVTYRNIGVLVAALCLSAIMLPTVMPVETGWSDAEIVLCRIIPFIAAAGCVSIYISKRLPRFSAVDFIAMAWAAYSLCRCWLDSSYPAAGYAMRMLMMSVLYLSLRLFSSRIRQVGYIFSCLILLFSLLEAGYIRDQPSPSVSGDRLVSESGTIFRIPYPRTCDSTFH